ncbi:MAG: chaperonin family protein RbcX [Cyanobacteriota bacterium]|nr:chaperonin family protein RbcX [Cyanobacteriota bacterium]
MNLKQIAKDSAKTLISYFTYQAMRTVLEQLSETDPPQAMWLRRFSFGENSHIQESEIYLEELLRERPALAFRIMTVREHIASEIADFLPEMARTGIQEFNMQHRRQHLERVTQLEFTSPSAADYPPEGEGDP